jgi:hypothetical protein
MDLDLIARCDERRGAGERPVAGARMCGVERPNLPAPRALAVASRQHRHGAVLTPGHGGPDLVLIPRA